MPSLPGRRSPFSIPSRSLSSRPPALQWLRWRWRDAAAPAAMALYNGGSSALLVDSGVEDDGGARSAAAWRGLARRARADTGTGGRRAQQHGTARFKDHSAAWATTLARPHYQAWHGCAAVPRRARAVPCLDGPFGHVYFCLVWAQPQLPIYPL